MKTKMKLIAAAALVLCGCQSSPADGSPADEPVVKDLYDRYAEAVNSRPSASSYTAAVSSKYTYYFIDNSNSFYQMDGVLEDAGRNIHIVQHLNANGMASEIEGYYDGSRLYNTFNGVSYYEDMSAKDVRDSMLVPLEPYAFPEDYLAGLSVKEEKNGDVTYSAAIAENRLGDVFKDRYDFNDMEKLDQFKVSSGTVTDTFDSEGRFLKETARFEAAFTYSGQEIKTVYEESVSYVNYDSTEVVITDAMQKDFAQYVVYTDIDTDAISDEPVTDDAPEATASLTFRKRLVNRLDYTEESDGVYTQDYNENESYTVDFNNHTFRYTNYTISYIYNWGGDIGSMGKCTFDFANDTSSSDCTEETLEMVKKVKGFLQMELFYCGLSLEELQADE